MRCSRLTYNRALHLVKTGKCKPTLLLKKLVVTSRERDSGIVKEMKSCPSEIRSQSVKSLVDAYKTAWAQVKNRKKKIGFGKRKRRRKREKNIKEGKPPFDFKYKSKRCVSDSVSFEPKSVKTEGQTLSFFPTSKEHRILNIRTSEPLLHPLKQMVKIVKNNGRWYFINLHETKRDVATPSERVIALDPGIRSMFTYFDPQTREWGDFMRQEEYAETHRKLEKKTQQLKKAMSEERGVKKNSLRRAWYRRLARASNLMTDIHYKFCKWLTSNYDVIISPVLKVSQMLKKEDSNLNKTTRSRLSFLSHYKFRQRLTSKVQQEGKILLDCDEAETTQGCSNCGFKKRDVGDSRIYSCDRCGCERPRDMNSAVDIYLKRLFS